MLFVGTLYFFQCCDEVCFGVWVWPVYFCGLGVGWYCPAFSCGSYVVFFEYFGCCVVVVVLCCYG